GTPPRRAGRFVNTSGASGAAGCAAIVDALSISKKLIACGFPCSSTVKSSFLRSVTGCPCLSWTTTLTWTSRVLLRKTGAGACCDGVWDPMAARTARAMRGRTRRVYGDATRLGQLPTANSQLPSSTTLEVGSWCLGSCPAARTNFQLPTPNSQAAQLGDWNLVSWELSRDKDQLPTPKQHNLEVGSWCLGSCPATRTNSQLPSSTTWRSEVGVLGVVPLLLSPVATADEVVDAQIRDALLLTSPCALRNHY